MSKAALLIGVVIIVIAAAVFAVFVMPTLLQAPTGGAPRPTQTEAKPKERVITVLGGEIEATKYGYAVEGNDLQSPGPDIRVRVADLPHTFDIAGERRFYAGPLWGV